MIKTYSQKLQDLRWKARRLEILKRDHFICVRCERRNEMLRRLGLRLEVHHIRYLPGLEPWEYADEWLQTLCQQCHEEVTVEGRGLKTLYRLLCKLLGLDELPMKGMQ
jgi:5-methylcytosine-specific restriction endonuclease McrA